MTARARPDPPKLQRLMGRTYSWYTEPRFSIRGIVLLITAIGAAAGVGSRPGAAIYVALLLLLALPMALCYAVMSGEGLGVFFRGASCPDCGERALARVAVVSFGPRFYRCTSCGARWKRHFLVADLEQAKGPRDDQRFTNREKGNPWMFAVSEDEKQAGVGSKTIDHLVSNQRRRHPQG